MSLEIKEVIRMAAKLSNQPTSLLVMFHFILTAIFISMSGAATVSDNGRISPCTPPCTEYGIVATARIDRMNLKIYKVQRHAKDAIAKVSDVRQVFASPSQWQINITAILYKPETFDPGFEALVQSATRVIPANHQLSTPFFFIALGFHERTYRQAFDAMVTRVVELLNDTNNNPFLSPSKRSVRIITGKKEVLFKWLTVNFLAGFFDQEKTHLKVGVLSLGFETVTQIAYPVHSMSMNVSDFVVIGAKPYLLIARFYTTYGFGTTLRNYFAKLGQGQGQGQGQDQDQGRQTSPCSPQGVRVRVVDGDVSKQYIGNGNVQECRKIISDGILNKYGRWTRSPYVRKPPRHIKFYALPEVVKVLHDIGCSGCDKVFTPAKINKAAREYCINSRSQRLADPPAPPPSTRNCLNANFFYVMLKSSYHLEDNVKITILPKTTHGIEEDWALGAFLYKLRLLTYEKLP